MKIVVDTNILVNVMLSSSMGSASYKIFEMCLKGELKPQVGCVLFNEYEDVLSRPEGYEGKAKYSKGEMQQLLDGFFGVCNWTKVSYLWRPNLRDEGGNHLINLAVASNAKWIVTQNIKDFGSGELKFSFRSISPDKFIEVEYGNNHV